MKHHIRRLTAFFLFIAILAACAVLVGIVIKTKVSQDQITLVNAKIELYHIKASSDTRDDPPYLTITLSKTNELQSFSDIFLSVGKLEDSTLIPYAQSNCDITVKYTKGSGNNLYTDVYETWYDGTSTDMLILKNKASYYQLSVEQSSAFRSFIKNKN